MEDLWLLVMDHRYLPASVSGSISSYTPIPSSGVGADVQTWRNVVT